jgi:hypothetical protein
LNRLGAGFNTEFRYSQKTDSLFGLPNSFYSIGLINRYHINSIFKEHLFELYFRGNKQFAGDEVDMGSFLYNQVFYQQLNFTFGHIFNRNEDEYGWTIGLSLLKGQKFYRISSEEAELFTETHGDYLELDADISIHQSDSAGTKVTDINGIGGSLDFSFYWKDYNNNTLTFTAKNLGAIQWNNKSVYVHADTAFRFDGIDFSDIFDLSDTIETKISLDSSLVQPYLSIREKEKYLSAVPAYISLSYHHILNSKINIEGEVGHLLFAGALPYQSASFHYTAANNHRFTLRVSNGSYYGLQAGLGYRVTILKRWVFQAQSDYLSSMLNSENGTAQGAFVSLTAYF